jgi:hypothetical protein
MAAKAFCSSANSRSTAAAVSRSSSQPYGGRWRGLVKIPDTAGRSKRASLAQATRLFPQVSDFRFRSASRPQLCLSQAF